VQEDPSQNLNGARGEAALALTRLHENMHCSSCEQELE
jgi:hypothetical protein